MASPSHAPVHARPAEAAKQVNLAEKLVDYKNYFRASQRYEEAVQLDPGNPRLYEGWAEVLHRRRKYPEAAEKCLKALSLDGCGPAYKPLAAAYRNLSEDQQRATDVELFKAISGASEDTRSAFINWGKALFQQKLYLRSAEAYQKAVAQDPKSAIAYVGWGNSLFRLGKPEEALEKFQLAGDLEPLNAAAYAGMAEAWLKQDHPAEAIDRYLDAIRLDPDAVGGDSKWMGFLEFLSAPEYREKLERLREVVSSNSRSAVVYLQWGTLLYQRDDYSGALEKFQRAATAMPSSVEAYQGCGDCLSQLGKRPEAISMYLKALELGPDPWFYSQWSRAFDALTPAEQDAASAKVQQIFEHKPQDGAYAYISWGDALYGEDFSRSVDKYAKAAELAPESAEAYGAWSAVLHQHGKYAEAIEKRLKAFELDPNIDIGYDWWHTALGALPEIEKDAAAGRLQELLAKNPDRAAVVYSEWGNELLSHEKYREAGQQFQQAMNAKADYAHAHVGLGKALCKQDRYPDAVEEFVKAAELDFSLVPWPEWIEAIDRVPAGEQEKQTERIQKAGQDRPEASSKYYSWGVALYNLQRYAEAAEKFAFACELNPESAGNFCAWGQALRFSLRYLEAFEKYQKVVDLDPGNEESQTAYACDCWGWVLTGKGKYNEAIPKYEIAVGFNNVNARVNYAWVLYLTKKFAESAEQCQKAAESGGQEARMYLRWGAALLALKKEREAKEKFELALKNTSPELSKADCYFEWGNALTDRDRIEEAIESFREAVRLDADHAYAHTNLGSFLKRQGKYTEGWKELENAAMAYGHGQLGAEKQRDASYFLYFGGVLNELGRRSEAKEILKKGLTLDPNNIFVLIDLVDLCLEEAANLTFRDGAPDPEGRAAAHAEAREMFRKAEQLLQDEYSQADDASIFLQWGKSYLSLEDYGKAKEQLSAAVAKDKDLAEAYNQLGILYTRKEEFQKAIECFREALRRNFNNLTARSNLAEAYMKSGALDRAETEYRRILAVTGNHLESRIGLGQLYVARADACKDNEFYDDAIHHFSQAIEIGKVKPSSASKRMKPKEWAPIFYSLGYSRVKLYGSGKLIRDAALLRSARQDFESCLQHDPEFHMAERAKKKIRERLRPSVERALEYLAPVTILLMAAFVFVLAQISFMLRGRFGDLRYYVPVTFGSLVLMIAGFYLPRLLKIKIAGIELEKTSVDQTTSISALEITGLQVSASSAGMK